MPLPNFLIIGAEKGGTTWLHAQLIKHPQVYLSPTKEVHYFNALDSNLKPRGNYALGEKWYGDFFRFAKTEHKAIGEATPMYLCDAAAPERIKALLPDAKLIAVLRQPANRAYSHYVMAAHKRHVGEPFEQIVAQKDERFVGRGLYGQQLARYKALFPEAQIKVLIFEEMFQDPEGTLMDVCAFLGVSPDFFRNNPSVHEKVFESSAYRSPAAWNLMAKITKRFRRSRLLGRLVDLAKRQGLADAVKGANKVSQSYDKMPEAQRQILNAYYAEDRALLETQLKRPIAVWG